eukprot:TRINITY_DN6670_c0_g2_i1.p1 TRINITY_DN6670_c0_g2~~TRINITY_DN6670_c0_g2_i1.p1  ORF type:complete len:212 (+),score=61.53 TRINITY_DN6670_c0_g2_i1:50-637(+)
MALPLRFYVTWALQQAMLVHGLNILVTSIKNVVAAWRKRAPPTWDIDFAKLAANVSSLLAVGVLFAAIIPVSAVTCAVALLTQVWMVRLQLERSSPMSMHQFRLLADNISVGLMMALSNIGGGIVFGCLLAFLALNNVLSVTPGVHIVLPIGFVLFVGAGMMAMVIVFVRRRQSDEGQQAHRPSSLSEPLLHDTL